MPTNSFSSLFFGELRSNVLNFLQFQRVLFKIQRCAVISEKTSRLNVATPTERKRKSAATMLKLSRIDGDKYIESSPYTLKIVLS